MKTKKIGTLAAKLKNPPANWPSDEEWEKIEKKLLRKPASYVLPVDANLTDKLKNELCAHFVMYYNKHNLSQKKMAKVIGISEARMSEILHYRFKRYTIDNLMKYLLRIKPDLKIKVA